MTAQEHEVGIFGGTFDPVHNGHLAIARSFLDSGFISKLWILLTPDPPHKTKQPITDYDTRLRMLKQAFSDWQQVLISDIEANLPTPSYTLQTLQYLTEEYPEKSFYWCIGEDSARDFKKWHKWQQILDYCELLIARRTSSEQLNLDQKIAENAHILGHDPINISSTVIRKQIKTGGDISALVPPVVKELIEDHNLYKIRDI